MIAHHTFEIAAYFLVASIINPISVYEEDVPRIDQGDFSNIRVVRRPLSEMHREIPLPVWMVFRNLQPERQELYHSAFVNIYELTPFCGKYQRRRMSEVHKAKMTRRPNLAVQHSG